MAEQQTLVYLGNRDAVHTHCGPDGMWVRTALPPGKRCTTVAAPEGMPLGELFTSITAAGGVWGFHADGNPVWVASTSPALAQLLGEHYGCPVRDPDPAPED